MESLTKQISAQIGSAVEKGLQKLSNLIDVSVANDTDIQNSTRRLGEAAEVISKATEDVSKNLAEASDTSSKLTNTVCSYRDMLLTAPRLQTMGTTAGPDTACQWTPKSQETLRGKPSKC